LVGLARKLTETIGTSNMPPVREQLGRLAAQAGMVEAMMHGMEAAGEQYGEWWIPNRHQLYSAQVVTQDLYPKMINVIASSRAARSSCCRPRSRTGPIRCSRRSSARPSAQRRSIRKER